MARRKSSDSDRRQFAKTLAVLAATQLTPAEAQAQVGDPLVVAAEALTDMVRSRYGKELTAEQVKQIKRAIQRQQVSAEMLKRVKLTNADEPAFVFRADLP